MAAATAAIPFAAEKAHVVNDWSDLPDNTQPLDNVSQWRGDLREDAGHRLVNEFRGPATGRMPKIDVHGAWDRLRNRATSKLLEVLRRSASSTDVAAVAAAHVGNPVGLRLLAVRGPAIPHLTIARTKRLVFTIFAPAIGRAS